MNLAFMSFSCPELTLEAMLTMARDLGYDAVEPRVASKHAHGIESVTDAAARGQIRKTVDRIGVPLCCIATSCRYADPAMTSETVQETHRLIDLAGDLGVGRLRVFGGAFPESVTREQAIDSVAGALAEAADHAAERNVRLCLETHDAWTDPVHVAKVMTRVNHSAVGVNWDIMHPVRQSGYTVKQSYEILKPWIHHVHLHDGTGDDVPLTVLPMGEGVIDHKLAMRLLHEDGYDEYLSGEWIGWTPEDGHLARELMTLRQYDREVTG